MALAARQPKCQLPRSVYIHVPFCRHRCGYCNFALVAGRDYLIDDYLRALEIEFQQIGGPRDVDTIYLGGGTPSHLGSDALPPLLDLVGRYFRLATDGEFTLEANPEDLPGEIESILIDSSVNRISLGIQSFQPAKLASLDRHHGPQQITEAVASAGRVTDRISADLMFGIAHETSDTWQTDLSQAASMPIDHISTYELTLEKGTVFWNAQFHGTPKTADEDTDANLFRQSIVFLTKCGFEHYEISSFARPGGRSRHNEVYWNGSSYWAFGPGAASFVDGVRRVNHHSVTRYLKSIFKTGNAIVETQELSPAQVALDCLVFGLRRMQGVDLLWFADATGYQAEQIVPEQTIGELVNRGLVTCDDNCLKLTDRGIMFADEVCQALSQTACND